MGQSGGKYRNKQEVQKITEQVNKLVGQGKLSHQEMIQQLNLTRSTFYRYLDKAVELNRKNYLSKSKRIINGYIERADNRVREMRKVYDEQGVKDTTILKRIDDMEKSKNQFKLDVGILEKSAERIKQEIKVVSYERPDWLKTKKELKEA